MINSICPYLPHDVLVAIKKEMGLTTGHAMQAWRGMSNSERTRWCLQAGWREPLRTVAVAAVIGHGWLKVQ